MNSAVALAVILITIYVPGAGGVNGSLTGADWRGGTLLQNGDAACGPAYPFGTVFVVLDSRGLDEIGASSVVICHDRGSAITNQNLDIAMIGGKVEVKKAFTWGRRWRQVMVFKNLAEYKRYVRLEKKTETR